VLKVLSLGAGVQSTTVLLMSCRGALPKLDAAVFADTQWEPAEVYEHLAWLEQEAARYGIPVHRVTRGNLRQDAIDFQKYSKSADGKRYASMPLHVLNPDGSRGMVRRQCTSEYKIEPIERFMRRQMLGLAHGQHAPREAVIEHWFGISADEPQRMRMSRHLWQRFVYPLCNIPDDYLPRPMRRSDCLAWLAAHYPDRVVPRSACIGCPFHSDDEWRRIKADPVAWADAVEFDRAIRSMEAMKGQVFLHRQCKPLDQVDLRTDVEKGQGELWRSECLGMCGV
jgi:hypothetical protein